MQVRSFYSGGQNIPFVCRRCLIRFCKLACLLYLIILLPLFWMKQRGYLITRTQFRYDLHSNYTSDPNTSYGAFLDGLVISLVLKNLVKMKWDKVLQTFIILRVLFLKQNVSKDLMVFCMNDVIIEYLVYSWKEHHQHNALMHIISLSFFLHSKFFG